MGMGTDASGLIRAFFELVKHWLTASILKCGAKLGNMGEFK